MFAKRAWQGVCVACASVCLVFGALAVEAPAASANGGAAGFVAGKLLSGVGSGAGEAVVGNLMAQAGLDPTTNALKEISEQLNKISNQIKDLHSTTNRALKEVLDASFSGRYDELDISKISRFQSDYACYLDASKGQVERNDCRAHFKAQVQSAQLWTAADKFNDLLLHPKITIVESYAKSLVGTRPFYTVEDQKKVAEFFSYLDDLQVAATTLSVEGENLAASEKGGAAVEEARAVARREAKTLEERRALQLARNPTSSTPGVLDTVSKLWLDTQARGRRDYWSAEQASGTWRLPTLNELLGIVRDRGGKTVRKYLIEDAGMGIALADVAEFGTTGEFWTSSADRCRLLLFGQACHEAVSTNDAYVRFYRTPPGSTEPKFYSFLVSGLSDKDHERYGFLLK
jgi:hypothetical protein